MPVLTLAVPLRNIHSQYNVAKIEDLEHYSALVSALIHNLEEILAP